MEIIGIIGAVPQEVALTVARLEGGTSEEYAGVAYHLGTYAGRRVVVCCGGMGKVNAAATTQVLITRYGAGAVVFSGVGGSLSPRLAMGQVVIGRRVLYHDADLELIAQSPPHARVFEGDPALLAAAEAACARVGVGCLAGTIATGDTFVGDAATKRRILEECQADCVEMEGAAVGQVAGRNGVPFVVLRTMSDSADRAYEAVAEQIFDLDSYVATASALVLALLEELAAGGA